MMENLLVSRRGRTDGWPRVVTMALYQSIGCMKLADIASHFGLTTALSSRFPRLFEGLAASPRSDTITLSPRHFAIIVQSFDNHLVSTIEWGDNMTYLRRSKPLRLYYIS